MHFLIHLKKRNPLLFWYGVLNFVAAIICAVLKQTIDVTANESGEFTQVFFL